MATWRQLISENMIEHGEVWGDIESTTLTDIDLDRDFDNGFGGSNGKAFTVWTKNRVYFPVVYDGAEWVDSVSRHPDGEATGHVGGQ